MDATKTLYRATYANHAAGITATTRWYGSLESAQDALMRRRDIGYFPYLGRVAGDVFAAGQCLYAPRNGGAVSLDVRDWRCPA